MLTSQIRTPQEQKARTVTRELIKTLGQIQTSDQLKASLVIAGITAFAAVCFYFSLIN